MAREKEFENRAREEGERRGEINREREAEGERHTDIHTHTHTQGEIEKTQRDKGLC